MSDIRALGAGVRACVLKEGCRCGRQYAFAEKRSVSLGAYEHSAVMLTLGMEAQRWAGALGHSRGLVPGWWAGALGLWPPLFPGGGGAERPAQGQVPTPTSLGGSSFLWLFLNVWGQRGLASPLGAL